MIQGFLAAIGIDSSDKHAIQKLAKKTGIDYHTIKHYDTAHIVPSQTEMALIEKHTRINRFEVCLKMGVFNSDVRKWLAENATTFSQHTEEKKEEASNNALKIALQTDYGKLYHEDCLDVLNSMESESVDLIFADPPFNLGKDYGEAVKDDLKEVDYEYWCQQWLDECVRALKPGGSLFLWHIPKWAQKLSGYLSQQLTFRHWIAVKQNNCLPIMGRLYPSHYALLYFTKGKKPLTFTPDRTQIETCKKCGQEHRDYGGHRNKLNPAGLTLQDVWLDIHPVKRRKKRMANELPLTLLDRVIEMASKPGDTLFDPFGGSGVSYLTAELKGRYWIGAEMGDIQPIVNRFENKTDDEEELIAIREKTNRLFSSEVEKVRKENDLWIETCSL